MNPFLSLQTSKFETGQQESALHVSQICLHLSLATASELIFHLSTKWTDWHILVFCLCRWISVEGVSLDHNRHRIWFLCGSARCVWLSNGIQFVWEPSVCEFVDDLGWKTLLGKGNKRSPGCCNGTGAKMASVAQEQAKFNRYEGMSTLGPRLKLCNKGLICI